MGAPTPERSSRRPKRDDAPAEVDIDRFLGSQDLTRWYTPLGRGLAGLVQWLGMRIGAHFALILTLVVGAAIAAGLTALFAEIYEAVEDADGVAGLDHPLLDFALTLRTPFTDGAATAYTNVAGVIGMPVLAVVIMVVLAIRRRSWTPVILIASAGAGSLLMTIAGKRLFGRARPPLADAVPPFEHSASFPSGHSLNAVVIAGIIAYLIVLRRATPAGRTVTIVVASLFAITIGLSRVFLGHHWFTDVLAAWVLGAAWLALVITAHRLYLTSRTRGSTDRPTFTRETGHHG